jgi:hypothetical protein
MRRVAQCLCYPRQRRFALGPACVVDWGNGVEETLQGALRTYHHASAKLHGIAEQEAKVCIQKALGIIMLLQAQQLIVNFQHGWIPIRHP